MIKSGSVITEATAVSGAYIGNVIVDKKYKVVIPIVIDSGNSNQLYTPRISDGRVSFSSSAANDTISYTIYGC